MESIFRILSRKQQVMNNINPHNLSYALRALPNFTWPLKKYIMLKSLKHVGVNFKFGHNSYFSDHRLIEVGDNVFMGIDTFISTNVSLRIGNDVMFGPRVTIIGGDHNFYTPGKPMRQVKKGGKNFPISIENDVWIGSNVTILKGVTIGEGCVIGAGSLVVKSLPPYSVCVGSPCKPIKLRFIDDDLSFHLKSVASKYNLQQVKDLYEK